MKPLWVLGIVSLSLLTVPPASAEEACADRHVDATEVDVYTFADCTVEVVAFEGLACLWGTERHSTTVGPATVTYYECSSPEPPPQSMASCQPVELNFALLAGSYVRLNADCTLDVVLFPEIICVGPWGSTIGQRVGPVYVQVSMCHPPVPIDD